MASEVVIGVDNILASMEGIIGRAASNRAMRRAMGKSLRPVAKKLRAKAPVGKEPHKTFKGRLVAPSFLRRNITVSTRIGKDKSRVFGTIRPRSEAWYGSLLEHGWRTGRRSKRVKKASRKGSLSQRRLDALGDTRKVIPGNKWWSSVADRADQEIIDKFTDQILTEIEVEWRK